MPGVVVEIGIGEFKISADTSGPLPVLEFYACNHGEPVGTVLPDDEPEGEPVASIVLYNLAALKTLQRALDHVAPLFGPVAGRVEIKVGDPDYKRLNLNISDAARARLAQKPSAAPVDCVVGALPSLEVERLREAVAVMADALTLADNIIATTCSMDTPREWPRALQKVTRARAALSATVDAPTPPA